MIFNIEGWPTVTYTSNMINVIQMYFCIFKCQNDLVPVQENCIEISVLKSYPLLPLFKAEVRREFLLSDVIEFLLDSTHAFQRHQPEVLPVLGQMRACRTFVARERLATRERRLFLAGARACSRWNACLPRRSRLTRLFGGKLSFF